MHLTAPCTPEVLREGLRASPTTLQHRAAHPRPREPRAGRGGGPALQRVTLLSLLLQQPRFAVLGKVRLVRLRSFTCSSTEFFLRKMKSKFTWLFMA